MPALPFTLRQLEVFAHLSGTGSFRGSADLLGISQASVSSQIKALENQLGFSLFVRRPGKSPTLTTEGMRFLEDYEQFRKAAARLSEYRKPQRQDDEPIIVRVRIGQGVFDGYVRHRVGPFLAANPAIEIDFEAQLPVSLSESILDGRTDLAIFHFPDTIKLPAHLRSLATVRGGIYGHRKFAQNKRLPLAASEVSSLPFIVAISQSSTGKMTRAALRSHGIVPRHVVGHSQYYDVIAALLENGIGVATFCEALLPPAMREEVILLYPMHDWRLVVFSGNRSDPRLELVERFLLSCILENPDYPAI